MSNYSNFVQDRALETLERTEPTEAELAEHAQRAQRNRLAAIHPTGHSGRASQRGS